MLKHRKKRANRRENKKTRVEQVDEWQKPELERFIFDWQEHVEHEGFKQKPPSRIAPHPKLLVALRHKLSLKALHYKKQLPMVKAFVTLQTTRSDASFRPLSPTKIKAFVTLQAAIGLASCYWPCEPVQSSAPAAQVCYRPC